MSSRESRRCESLHYSDMNEEVRNAIKSARKRISQLGIERRETKVLVRAVVEFEAKRFEERTAWVEFYKAEREYANYTRGGQYAQTRANEMRADVQHKRRVLVVLGVPPETFD